MMHQLRQTLSRDNKIITVPFVSFFDTLFAKLSVSVKSEVSTAPVCCYDLVMIGENYLCSNDYSRNNIPIFQLLYSILGFSLFSC